MTVVKFGLEIGGSTDTSQVGNSIRGTLHTAKHQHQHRRREAITADSSFASKEDTCSGERLTSVPGRELMVQVTAQAGMEAVDTVELAGVGAEDCARMLVAARQKSTIGRVKETIAEFEG